MRIPTLLALTCALALGSAAVAASPADYPVFFAKGSAEIDSNATTTIAIAAKAALAHPLYPVIVTGSSDTAGTVSAGQAIAQTRAQSVARALVADGVPTSRIAIVSAGPLAAPGTAQGGFAQFSRRVLIQIGN